MKNIFFVAFIWGQSLVKKLVVILDYNLNKINTTIDFENLTVDLYILYALNTYVKFCVNRILFTISSIILYFMYNFKLQKLAI